MSFWKNLFGYKKPAVKRQPEPALPSVSRQRSFSRPPTHEQKSALYRASEKGDLEKVASLLDECPQLMSAAVDTNDSTALHIAARAGQKNIVEYLLSQAANINAFTRSDKKTPYLMAEERGHVAVMEVLRQWGSALTAEAALRRHLFDCLLQLKPAEWHIRSKQIDVTINTRISPQTILLASASPEEVVDQLIQKTFRTHPLILANMTVQTLNYESYRYTFLDSNFDNNRKVTRNIAQLKSAIDGDFGVLRNKDSTLTVINWRTQISERDEW